MFWENWQGGRVEVRHRFLFSKGLWSNRKISSHIAVQSLGRVQLFETPWTAARRLSCPSPSPRVCSNSSPLSWGCYPTISSSVVPFSSCPQSFPTSGSFPMSQRLTKLWMLQHQYCQLIFRIDFLQDGLIWPPCCPRESQESSPAPEFKSINSLMVSYHICI